MFKAAVLKRVTSLKSWSGRRESNPHENLGSCFYWSNNNKLDKKRVSESLETPIVQKAAAKPSFERSIRSEEIG